MSPTRVMWRLELADALRSRWIVFTAAVYSAGRWSVYAISLLAISKMTVAASRSIAARNACRAVR